MHEHSILDNIIYIEYSVLNISAFLRFIFLFKKCKPFVHPLFIGTLFRFGFSDEASIRED